MATLKEKLLAPGTRSKVLDDCVVLIDQEVASKGGLTGLAIKGAYAMVKAVSSTIIRESMDSLLDAFTDRMEPFYAEHQAQGAKTPLRGFLTSRSSQVANALLGITDDRARRASGTLKKAYEKLRPTGEKHVQEAVPRIADLLQKYAG